MTDEIRMHRLEVSGSDLEAFVTVGGDLEFLAGLPMDRLYTHTEVRVVAGVLRRLLIDNLLGVVVRASKAGGEPLQLGVRAIEIDSALNVQEPWVRFAYAGGAELPGAAHNGFILAVVPASVLAEYGSQEQFMAAHPMPQIGERKHLTMTDFLASTSVAIRPDNSPLIRISRKTVLQYMANRKGGVHFDPRRRLELPARKKVKEYEYALLDFGLLRLGHLSGPEFEVMSMAHAIVQSDWAPQIIEIAQNVAPAEFFGDPADMNVFTGLRGEDGTGDGWETWKFDGPPASE
ncbi:MAG: hypothetical protein AB7I24_08300 [Candidatus Nanopelagicales bacterium]|jgi:hypothetical protein